MIIEDVSLDNAGAYFTIFNFLFKSHPSRSTLFPYTTLFRSGHHHGPATGPARRPSPRPQGPAARSPPAPRSEEHTSELQSHVNLVCRLLLEKKNVCIGNIERTVRCFVG